jgi:hypothetical protein
MERRRVVVVVELGSALLRDGFRIRDTNGVLASSCSLGSVAPAAAAVASHVIASTVSSAVHPGRTANVVALALFEERVDPLHDFRIVFVVVGRAIIMIINIIIRFNPLLTTFPFCFGRRVGSATTAAARTTTTAVATV